MSLLLAVAAGRDGAVRRQSVFGVGLPVFGSPTFLAFGARVHVRAIVGIMLVATGGLRPLGHSGGRPVW